VTILAFLRIGTHPRVFARPMSVGEATGYVSAWLGQPMVDVLDPGPRHWEILSRLMSEAQATANLTSDAHLAALAIEYGATLVSSDRDFTRFIDLKLINPLTAR
jgi:toxin-antitoxin system PIN domain toxin